MVAPACAVSSNRSLSIASSWRRATAPLIASKAKTLIRQGRGVVPATGPSDVDRVDVAVHRLVVDAPEPVVQVTDLLAVIEITDLAPLVLGEQPLGGVPLGSL